LGLQWGAADGPAEKEILEDEEIWAQGYITLSMRFSFDIGDEYCPYLEVGAGQYGYSVSGKEGSFYTPGRVGFRLAFGNNFYIGNFYIAPEVSYHMVQYDEGEYNLDHHPLIAPGVFGPKKYDVDFDARGDMLIFQVKVGYHWRGDADKF
jgi:hypothetical protein